MLSGVPGVCRLCPGLEPEKVPVCSFHEIIKNIEKNMKFCNVKPPGPVLRRLILKKVYDKIKTVICKQTTLRKAYLYIGE